MVFLICTALFCATVLPVTLMVIFHRLVNPLRVFRRSEHGTWLRDDAATGISSAESETSPRTSAR